MRLKNALKRQGDFCFRWRSYLPLLVLPLFFVCLMSFGQNLISKGALNSASSWDFELLSLYDKPLDFNAPLVIIALVVGILANHSRASGRLRPARYLRAQHKGAKSRHAQHHRHLQPLPQPPLPRQLFDDARPRPTAWQLALCAVFLPRVLALLRAHYLRRGKLFKREIRRKIPRVGTPNARIFPTPSSFHAKRHDF